MPTNRYFDFTSSLTRFVRNTLARASDINNRLDEVSVGFDTVQTEMDLKAPLASPALTGTPTAPNAASVATDTTQIATTAWVQDVRDAIQTNIDAKAAIASPTFTGTPAAPNPPAVTTDSTQIATTAWVQDVIGATAVGLPVQTGNSGKVLGTNGTSASWIYNTLSRSARTSNTILGAADIGSLVDITSGTFTQTFDACATLAAGWWCYIRNSGTGTVTLDPNASETIDGATSGALKPGMTIFVQCDGSALHAVRIGPHTVLEVLTSGTTWTCPIGVRFAKFSLVGGGGGPNTSNSGTGGGGGTAIKLATVSPGTAYTYAIGAAGTGTGSGGNTSITIGATTITANGGTSGFPGAGGSATNGDINVTGSAYTSSGVGGASLFGFGASSAPSNASGYGGGGAYQTTSYSASQGAIFIEY